ncbi:hypothetical protein CK203_039832 [Vitis vinifera]|uniref:Uncharacterized protein n=1 Tax=Vitis vinifera TaxID=29760 RepID=A0A438HQL0_VITVI|nr:hypothetical protein CK203_039832 [Vitis vinifera]
MATRKGREGEMLESVYSVIALVFVLVACVELCDAALSSMSIASFNTISPAFPSDLASPTSTTTPLRLCSCRRSLPDCVIVPVRDINITFIGGVEK